VFKGLWFFCTSTVEQHRSNPGSSQEFVRGIVFPNGKIGISSVSDLPWMFRLQKRVNYFPLNPVKHPMLFGVFWGQMVRPSKIPVSDLTL